MLVIPGVVLTAAVVALAVSPVFGVSFGVAFLVGGVLAATDPAILIPLFDRLRLRPKVSQTVIAESAFNDPTGTVLALTVAGALAAGRRRRSPTRSSTSRRASRSVPSAASRVACCWP